LHHAGRTKEVTLLAYLVPQFPEELCRIHDAFTGLRRMLVASAMAALAAYCCFGERLAGLENIASPVDSICATGMTKHAVRRNPARKAYVLAGIVAG
jgi:hypothetical protein